MTGWIAVSRTIHEHPIFRRRPDRLYAWTWMIANAAWKDTKQDVGGAIVTVARGELCASQEMLCEGTGMTRKALRNFISMLESDGAVRTRPGTKGAKSRAILTICNYEKYQTSGPSEGQRRAKEGPIKETREPFTVTNVTGAAAPTDPAKVMFDAGIQLLTSAGKSEQQARAIIGRWRKGHSTEAVITAISRAKREGAVEPVSFVESCLRFTGTKGGNPEIGERRELASGKTVVWAGAVDQWVEERA